MRAASSGVQKRRGRLLDDLLVTPLDRAFAFEEVDDIAVLVPEDLEFDVPRMLQVLFDQHLLVAECAVGFASRARQGVSEFTLAGVRCACPCRHHLRWV